MVKKTTEEKIHSLMEKHDRMQKALTLEFSEKYRELMNQFIKEKEKIENNHLSL